MLRRRAGDRADAPGDRRSRDLGQGVSTSLNWQSRAQRAWLRENLPAVDPQKHVTYQVELKSGSDELSDIFRPGSSSYQANDTSAAVGYAPLSETEQLVIAAEKYLNGRDFKHKFPESGQDVKIMGIRSGARLDLTVAMPLLDRYVTREAAYFRTQGRDAPSTWLRIYSRVSTFLVRSASA